MSRKLQLAPTVDRRTREYVDAAIAETPQPENPELQKLRLEVASLRLLAHGLKAEVSDLTNLLNALRNEDRLTLTRARLVRAINSLEASE